MVVLRALRAAVVADAEVGAVADRLAVAADDLRLVGDVADGDADLRHGADAGSSTPSSTVGRATAQSSDSTSNAVLAVTTASVPS